MGLDGIRVNHAELNNACIAMHATVKKMDEDFNELEGKLAPLKSDWSGEAQNTYRLAKAQWDKAFQEMRDLLDQSERTVYEANDEYKAADKRGALQFDYGS